MPHLVILYTPNLEPHADFSALCRALADVLLAAQDEQGKNVFPPGGTRVMAYPAAHYAVSDGGAAGKAIGSSGDYGFIYLNLRMGQGRSPTTHTSVGGALLSTAKHQLATLFADPQRPIGLTLQIDVGHEVFDGKHSTLHRLFPPRSN
jgi:5-carboxymethyl-2-hydroxymuconate isomerase